MSCFWCRAALVGQAHVADLTSHQLPNPVGSYHRPVGW